MAFRDVIASTFCVSIFFPGCFVAKHSGQNWGLCPPIVDVRSFGQFLADQLKTRE